MTVTDPPWEHGWAREPTQTRHALCPTHNTHVSNLNPPCSRLPAGQPQGPNRRAAHLPQAPTWTISSRLSPLQQCAVTCRGALWAGEAAVGACGRCPAGGAAVAALTARALRMSSQRPGVAAAGQVEAAPELGAGILALVGVIHGANCRGMGVMIIRTQKSRRQSRLPKPSEPSPRPSLQVALRAGGGAESFTGKLQRIGP